jgi:hypothetical protein
MKFGHRPNVGGMAWVRLALVLGGLAMISFALFGGGASSLTQSTYLRFVLLVALWTLVVVLPLAIATGWLIGRVVPVVIRPVVQGAGMATALIVGIALPAVLGRGRQPDLPSALPRNYATGLWTVLAVVWAAAVALSLVRIVRRRARPRTRPPAGPSAADKPEGAKP